jgi:hypothetical protein
MNTEYAEIHSNINDLTIPYSEEDVIEFDANIIPKTSSTKDIPMIMTYEDGNPA